MSRWLLPLGIVALIGVGAFVVAGGIAKSAGPVAWATLGTRDVHSLAFVGNDVKHVLFGHHNGLLVSTDGGRSWAALPVREDAMSMGPATDGSIVIAGHEVFTASRDGGKTWARIPADLPSLDIHGFTRDPADPARMWAYLATGGLWASADYGLHWSRVRQDNVVFPLAVRHGSMTRLLGADTSGIVASDDGGRTWQALGAPPTYPITSLAASATGSVIYAGGLDGLFRSSDGGATWQATGYRGSAFAIATSDDGGTVALVSKETAFYRSADGGANWPGP